jgi:hypothetical protein
MVAAWSLHGHCMVTAWSLQREGECCGSWSCRFRLMPREGGCLAEQTALSVSYNPLQSDAFEPSLPVQQMHRHHTHALSTHPHTPTPTHTHTLPLARALNHVLCLSADGGSSLAESRCFLGFTPNPKPQTPNPKPRCSLWPSSPLSLQSSQVARWAHTRFKALVQVSKHVH